MQSFGKCMHVFFAALTNFFLTLSTEKLCFIFAARSVTQAVPGEDKKRVKCEIAYVTFAASVILRKMYG
jgi:hypothetical protein